MTLEFSKIDKDLLVYKNSCVYLFGAAKLGKSCKELLERQGAHICGFIDNGLQKQGTEYCGVRVISFPDFMERSCREENTLVQITSRFERDIIEQMEQAGYVNYISYTEFAVRLKQLNLYLATRENMALKKQLYKCDLQSNSRTPILSWIKNNYFGNKILSKYNTFDIMLSAFTVGNHAILETNDGKNLIALNHSYRWMDTEIWNMLKEENIRVVIGVGDPIAQNISLMYQVCENEFWDLDEYWTGGGCVQAIFNQYIIGQNNKVCWYNVYKDEAGSNFLIQDFFEQQVEPFLGIDIYQYPFDKEKGYSVLKHDNMEVFIYQVERIESMYNELQAFLEAEDLDKSLNVDMLEDNWLENMWYGKSYRQAKESLILSKEYFEECYSSKYIRHFYHNEDIEGFRKRWERNVH